MDMSSMIMGAAIASVAWICFVPWTKLKDLRAQEEQQGRTDPPEADPR
jgi:hypothetical protein